MNHGEWTARVARALSEHLQQRNYDVLFDHGHTDSDSTNRLGKLASWFGPSYRYEAILGHLDIAIIAPGTQRVAALIEIEESTDNPKTLIGDVFATLLGEQLTFQGTRRLQLGEWTTLLVLAQSTRSRHPARLEYLQKAARQLKAHMVASNSTIGNIVLDSFTDEADLEVKIKGLVDAAIERTIKHGGAVVQ